MLANQARRFGETLVDRHVLSRDDLEDAIDEAERSERAAAHGAAPARPRRQQGPDGRARRTDGRPVHRLPRHADPPGRAGHCSPPSWRASYARCPSTSRTTSSWSRSRSRPTTTRSPRSVHATTYEIIPAVADRCELARAIDMIYGPAADEPAGVAGTRRRRMSRRGDPVLDELHINDLLELVHPVGRLRPAPHRRFAARRSASTAICARCRDLPVLNGSQIRQMVFSILTQKQREKFENELELDTSYALPGKGRFRVNVFLQRDSVGCVMRAIPYEIVDFDRLGVPPAVKTWAYLPRGLVLVTGPTGSGKSTTLASLDRHREPRALGAHHDGRGPDRVPAPAQAFARSTSARSARTRTRSPRR